MNKKLVSPLQSNAVDLEPVAQRTGLLVIDMQKPYFALDPLAKQQAGLVDACNRLIALFEKYSLPVFYSRTRHDKQKQTWTLNMLRDEQGFAYADQADVELAEGLNYDPASAVMIHKTRDSAFICTDLESQMKARDVRSLVLCGVSTHSCVGLTAADAYARNYQVILATDAIASDKKRYHDMMLSLLSEEYRQPQLSTREITAFIADGFRSSNTIDGK